MTMRRVLHITAAFATLCALFLSSDRPIAAQAPAAPAAPRQWPSADVIRQRRSAAEARPLFTSELPLPITLAADFKAVQRDRNVESSKVFPATLSVARQDGSIARLPVQIRTRGHSRRLQRTCSFAPLRIQFDTATTVGTIFEGQRALKLGTHCREADLYEQYMPREYLAYRIFNLLTPRSFRARLVDASYINADNGEKLAERQALFIEDDDEVARRHEGRITEARKLVFSRLERDTLTLMTLFEYMIGNTDVSIYEQHNARIIEKQGVGLFYPVPYDFDYSGLVNARYAVPAKVLNLTSVTERAYMGPCRPLAELEPYFAQFKAVKPKVMEILAAVPGLSEGYRKDATNYLEKFYETIEKPRQAKEAFVDRCNKVGM
jgi:hypothetical protein